MAEFRIHPVSYGGHPAHHHPVQPAQRRTHLARQPNPSTAWHRTSSRTVTPEFTSDVETHFKARRGQDQSQYDGICRCGFIFASDHHGMSRVQQPDYSALPSLGIHIPLMRMPHGVEGNETE